MLFSFFSLLTSDFMPMPAGSLYMLQVLDQTPTRYTEEFMNEIVSPAKSISGTITLPGDKSISHRYGMLGAIAEGVTTIHNYSTGEDCQSTLACMASLGATIERADSKVVIHGGELREPAGPLDAGNSG